MGLGNIVMQMLDFGQSYLSMSMDGCGAYHRTMTISCPTSPCQASLIDTTVYPASYLQMSGVLHSRHKAR